MQLIPEPQVAPFASHQGPSLAVTGVRSTTEQPCSMIMEIPTNEDGQTMLHRLCQDRTVSLTHVRACLDQYPSAVERKDVYGRTPLFYALKRACALPIVECLFDAFPSAVIEPDFCGETGLYLLFHPSKDASLLASMLERQPALALYRRRSFADQTLVDQICGPYSRSTASPMDADGRWTKLVLTVRAAHRASRHLPPVMGQELHMAVELGLSPFLLAHFVRHYPSQASQPMVRCGNLLPLHHVVAQTNFGRSKGAGDLMRALIEAYPAAASLVTSEGEYPLHVALRHGYRWDAGVGELVSACHNALHAADAVESLCPVLLAAAAARRPEGGDLDTVFMLLRERPFLHKMHTVARIVQELHGN